MTISDYLIIFATLLGPLLAVQTQKWLEAARERRRRKEHVFQILMATRAARLSPEHVGALNQLDLAFYGKRTLGFSRRTRSEQQVLDSWKEYLDHLCAKVDPNDNGQFAVWCTHNDELFTNILFNVAQDLGLRFDRVQLKKGVYSPIAHGNIEQENREIRQLVIALLRGENPLAAHIKAIDQDPERLARQTELVDRLSAAFGANAALNVVLSGRNANEPPVAP